MAALLFRFTSRRRTIAVDVPHLAFATAIVGWCVWFCQDAMARAARCGVPYPILPASVLAVILDVCVVAGCVRILSTPEQDAAPARRLLGPGMAGKIAGTMALLSVYVIAGAAYWI